METDVWCFFVSSREDTTSDSTKKSHHSVSNGQRRATYESSCDLGACYSARRLWGGKCQPRSGESQQQRVFPRSKYRGVRGSNVAITECDERQSEFHRRHAEGDCRREFRVGFGGSHHGARRSADGQQQREQFGPRRRQQSHRREQYQSAEPNA